MSVSQRKCLILHPNLNSSMQNSDKPNIIRALEDEIVYVENLREIKNLARTRATYNTIIFCKAGCVLVEVGGQQQVKVHPGQLMLIPLGKLVQPMFVSTDVDASILMISDRVLITTLGSQINIWNRAMYMKELYVIGETGWLSGIENYAQSIFKQTDQPKLFQEVMLSFIRTMLLMICETLLKNKEMDKTDDISSTHDKDVFNRFLQLLNEDEMKHRKVSYYAEKINITPKYLSSICKRVSGKSPMRWITEAVMEECYRMLTQTDFSIKEISNTLGFPNASFFGQYFKEEAHVTPNEYRKEHKRI